jgi:mRNA turnover protein 4
MYVFRVENMRNVHLQQVRQYWKNNQGGRFFYGKSKVMQKALGTTPEEEVKDNLHLLSNASVSLLCNGGRMLWENPDCF